MHRAINANWFQLSRVQNWSLFGFITESSQKSNSIGLWIFPRHVQHPVPRVFHTFMLSRCGAIIHRDRGACTFPAARSAAYRDSFITLRTGAACIRPGLDCTPRELVEGVRACAHVLTPVVAVIGVRLPWHPQNGRFASTSSIREFQTVRSTARDVGPSATVIIPRTIYDARLDNGRPTVKLRRCYFDLS